MTVTAGATWSILGVYGLGAASFLWAFRSPLALPRVALRTMGPPVALFLLYNVGELMSSSGLVALATGAIGGLVLARGVADATPPLRRVGMATAAALVLTVAAAVPVRGIADVRPELARIIEVETKTASEYQAAVARFRKGRTSSEALANLIDQKIVPELQAARTRLSSINGVPDAHQALVAAADEYLRLRDEGWRQRSAALRKSSVGGLREADKIERASLDAFKRFAPPDPA